MRRGMAMWLVFGIFGILFLLALATATLTRQQGRLTGAFVEGQIAFQAAEAGLEQGLFLVKEDLEENRTLARAMVGIEPVDLEFESSKLGELGRLAPRGGRVELKVWGRYEPIFEVGDTGRIGNLTLHSRAVFHTPQGLRAVRQLAGTWRVTGEDLSPVAPDHGFMLRDPRSLDYFVPGFTLDARDFEVYGGHVYLEGGMGIELTEHIINREFRPMGELGLLDLGYDAWNLTTLFNGGVNFTHSRVVEHSGTRGLTRKYYDFQGLDNLFGPGAAWVPREEQYVPQVRNVPPGYYDDADINLRSADDYRRMASTVIDPVGPGNLDGNPRHNELFRTLSFAGPLGFRTTTYRNVLPLYGWGDWRRVTRIPFSNATRRHDLSAAIPLDGVTFVRGDVFLEGWYEGIGTLVVQGNVFVGGDVIGLPPTVTGYHSFLNLVVLEDPARETGATRIGRRTGKVIYRPHHDTDFDARGLLSGRDTDPFLDVAMYARNGLESDRTSTLDKFFNMEIEFNLATDFFEWPRLPNDVRINGTDPRRLFEEAGDARRYGVSPFFVPRVSTDMVMWTEETPVEDEPPVEGPEPAAS